MSIYDFINEHEDKLKLIACYDHIVRDCNHFHAKFKVQIADGIMRSRILSNEYGHICDFRAAKLCRDWLRKNCLHVIKEGMEWK